MAGGRFIAYLLVVWTILYLLHYIKQRTDAGHTPQGDDLRAGKGWALIGPALGYLLGGAGGQLNDDIALSLFGERANQGKHLALERVVERRDLNELALWMMLICSMLVRV
jgi:hypothetical protein